MLLSSCVALTSCATSEARRAKANEEALRLTGFWQPYNLYLLSGVHTRLHVEVDAVQGCSPSEEMLTKLRDFLATHCDKPDGIQVVRSDIIPRASARGVMPSALARKYLNGPQESAAAPSTAFLYVLFYDDVLSDRPIVVETGHPGMRFTRSTLLKNRNPHVDLLPYPGMIYMNTHWSPSSLHADTLLHEVGHILGLSFRKDKALEGHCGNGHCLMNAGFHIGTVLGLDSRQQRLCERCLAQLAENRSRSVPANLRFIGPVLVRSESSYHVLNLPHRAKIVFGDLSAQDCREFLAEVRSEKGGGRAPETERNVGASGGREMLQDVAKLRQIVPTISADPDPTLRPLAARLWTVCAERYGATGKFVEAIDACRTAIKTNPDDDVSYNLLAWLKATCSDPAIRDGQEAVSAATKACELSGWREWNWIDTLAAAYAEVGDFKRAIHFQERALRTGHPNEADQKAMRERLAQYQRSQPVRTGS